MRPSPIPHGATARRLEWSLLPPYVRDLVERRCGAPVVEALSQGAGFTPGFASVLVCADGSRHFVKAASVLAQAPFAQSYRQEARKLGGLPARTPAPRLLWTHDDGEWVVLGIEHVDAHLPARPWRADELDRCLDVLEDVARVLGAGPPALALERIEDDLAALPSRWDELTPADVDTFGWDLPGFADHLAEAASLAAGFGAAVAGTTVVHTDLRDDNLLLLDDGRVLVCDWNWPVLGAAWVDTVTLLVNPRGDGVDVEALLAARPLTRDVPPLDVDAFLAALAGYFLTAATQAVPTTSPHIRDAQRWQGEACWDWLAERRGWL